MSNHGDAPADGVGKIKTEDGMELFEIEERIDIDDSQCTDTDKGDNHRR